MESQLSLLYGLSFLTVAVAFAFAAYLYLWVKKQKTGNARIQEVSALIREGANTFMRREYKILAKFALVAALVILVLGLPAVELRKAVIGILQVNAMIHTAAVSAMSEKEFHDIMEGLGMLMGLSDPPSADGARRLMAALSAVQG